MISECKERFRYFNIGRLEKLRLWRRVHSSDTRWVKLIETINGRDGTFWQYVKEYNLDEGHVIVHGYGNEPIRKQEVAHSDGGTRFEVQVCCRRAYLTLGVEHKYVTCEPQISYREALEKYKELRL